ncbi:MAG TPA: SpoIID/LytB domain-containing protein [Planctomycetota bacterium]|nr:SpoIID/LytB domain-containing protein [Planctomycetota bacterium]OQC19518.1 MAG: Amidase enhancer precursor [Planctomycetes bacterium ADurb.Bin069]NMD35065.1 SpoIID/LytB domain-containing protein [Planctomycetota bacterium]HNR99888.1 SpoIID/LytB domain-containing protein [Planctomycetota bacterium]HNU26404.1 SpoIID/LytB domain-containing protein [Planctomycetota bacterium]
MAQLSVRDRRIAIAVATIGALAALIAFLQPDRSAARALLLPGEFKPAGPPVRVRLKQIARRAAETGVFLQSSCPLTVVFSEGQLPPLSLAPCDGVVKFEAGALKWHTGQDAAAPFVTPFRIRLVLAEPTGCFRIEKDAYTGVLEFAPDKALIVNELDFESYLLGVVGSEMPARFQTDALRAQAITSRTYALYNWLFIGARRAWHLDDDAFSQVYRGQAALNARVKAAVAETCGLVMVYDGKVFQAYYHSTCGGGTRKASAAAEFVKEPDIRPLAGAACGFCSESPAYAWQEEYNERHVRNALAARAGAALALGRITAIEPVAPPEDGGIYANRLRIWHAGNPQAPVEILATIFKSALNSLRESSCKSTAFTTFQVHGDVLRVEGRGFGHGVGMCQYGAQGQARQGRDYLRILRHYYPGIGFMRAWSREGPAAQGAAAAAGF